jgi:hypothetical protein
MDQSKWLARGVGCLIACLVVALYLFVLSRGQFL